MPKAQKKEEKPKKKGEIKKIIVAIAIAIIFAFFIGYLISSFYEEPRYENYCNESIIMKNYIYNTSTSCEQAGGVWNAYYADKYVQYASETGQPAPITTPIMQGSCDLGYYCSRDLQKDMEIYNRNVFFITSAIGIITIIISFMLALEFVSNGFLAGSIFLILYGTTRYWGFMTNKVKAVMLGLVLALLVWIAYKKLSK